MAHPVDVLSYFPFFLSGCFASLENPRRILHTAPFQDANRNGLNCPPEVDAFNSVGL